MTNLADWPVLVLTAGLATRLRPLSDVRAKAAMPVAGTPIVTRLLSWLRAAGITRVVLNLHHLPETITTVVGDGSQHGLSVKYSWEPVVLGSAGGPRRALPLLEAERFFIVNGDTLTDCDLSALAGVHLQSGASVTMAVVEGDVQRYGGVLFDSEMAVHGFGKPTGVLRARHFIGVQAVDRDVFAHLRDDEPSETVKMLYPQAIAGRPGSVRAHETNAEFLDVGTARDYLATVTTIAARERQPFDVGAGCRVGAGVRLERTVLWDRVCVGAGAQLINCVLADDVTVAGGARYENAVLVNGPGGVSVSTF